jgi:REP element-mobilizing transposase RayT
MSIHLNFARVTQPSKKRAKLPFNPGLRDMVESKQAANPDVDLKSNFGGWKERGYLPHRDQSGLTQFVTFRLADTFPAALKFEWQHLSKIEDNAVRRREYETYLDRSRGSCYLRRESIATLVQENLLRFSKDHRANTSDSFRYQLRAWCIMPNHVHVLFEVGSVPMWKIVRDWKAHTGRLANQLLGQSGSFWADDYFDTFMRDAEHENRTVRYIENNPTKAKLVLKPEDWVWSSARHRDQYDKLKLPEL